MSGMAIRPFVDAARRYRRDVQIAGLVARRIVTSRCAKARMSIAGQRIGLIRFGSRAGSLSAAGWAVLAIVGQSQRSAATPCSLMRSAQEPPRPRHGTLRKESEALQR